MKKIFLLMAIVALVVTGCQKNMNSTSSYGSSNTNNAGTNAP